MLYGRRVRIKSYTANLQSAPQRFTPAVREDTSSAKKVTLNLSSDRHQQPAKTAVPATNTVPKVEVPALKKKVEDAIEKIEEAKEIIEEEVKEKLDRKPKTLVNTFPFNQHSDHHGDHHPAQHHRHSANSFDNRISRQEATGGSPAIDIGAVAAAGERCIDKVIMVEETEYDDVIECDHSYTERCYTTYKTDYSPQQEEECEENFKKNCFIEFKAKALEETVQFCFTPLVRNCNLPGPTECTTEYRSECTTRYHEHDVEDDVVDCRDEEEVKCQQVTHGYTSEEQCTRWPVKKCALQRQKVKKYTPETECKKKPFELCGPAACPVEPGAEQCQERKETVVE